MSSKLRYLLQSEKGGLDGVFSLLFGIMFFCIFMLLSVSAYQGYVIRDNLKTASSEVLQIMKVENGADGSTRSRFDELLRKMGMDPSKVSFSATPKLVQRGDALDVEASVDYNVFALKAIGVDYSVKIKVHVSGLAHKFIR
ncbi:DUF4320 family protein [Paenibacillus alvei]|uniref:DUF4320 family protein n=2 Tax=Paenibacillus alvei TaxID=44250 RepID=A0ABT4H8G2_PAEAL|nr:DUF4320 family protein [Paenibacillus alvei]MCY9542847.1 DUF4320 family protein [Paenibacillus alvei]MCY9736098.1 DUF4320 family protein [Paenibacillus alvei]MCY9764904.1 DUF4320 family protein [Paenibacillus alvei]MCY9771006.1 DUF4320 family protein [Paenibacillus alvei]MEC0084469.1 DUF4320 family protein [Paenibacillus alvei]